MRAARINALLLVGLLLAGCGSDDPGSTLSEVEPTAAPTETVSDTSAPSDAVTHTEPDSPDTALEGPPVGSLLATEGERTRWTGSIGYDIVISMWLAQNGDLVRGEITYETVGEPIMILGRSYPDSDGYFLQEFLPNGHVTGYITLGSVTDGVISEGTWGEQPLILEFSGVDDLPYFFDPLVRPGAYAFSHAPFEGDECCGPEGSLTISDVKDDSLTVAFDNHNGGPGFNLASVDATTIPLENNVALYESTEDGYDCAFEVVVFDGFAFVEYVDDRFDCGFGNAASVVGNYVLTAQSD